MMDILTSSKYLVLSNFTVDPYYIAPLHMLGGYIYKSAFLLLEIILKKSILRIALFKKYSKLYRFLI